MFGLQRPASVGDIPQWLSLAKRWLHVLEQSQSESIFNRTRSNAGNCRNPFLFFFLPCAAHLWNPAEHCRAPEWVDSRSAESRSTNWRPETHGRHVTSGAEVNTKLSDAHLESIKAVLINIFKLMDHMKTACVMWKLSLAVTNPQRIITPQILSALQNIFQLLYCFGAIWPLSSACFQQNKLS